MIVFREQFRFDRQGTVVCLSREQVKSSLFPRLIATEIRKAVHAGQFEGAKGEIFPLLVGTKVILLLGLGKEKDLTMTGLRICLRQAFLARSLKKLKTVEVILSKDSEEAARAAVEAAIIGVYSWRKYITPPKDDRSVLKKEFTLVTAFSRSAGRAVTIAESVNYARDLVNDNADLVTAEYLERQVRSLVKGRKNVSLEVLDRSKLKAKKLGLILAVNQGSAKEPRVLVVRYAGAGRSVPYTAIVGKGLTFDTGGLNLKPSGSMETMREDMSGAAAVWATLKAVLVLKPKKNMIFAAGMAENAIDANAYKPGDVLTGYSGKTVEIGNTDAEGRLVLADVLSYVIKNYKPARVIDIATLTGACVVALGHDHAGILGNNEALIQALLKSAQKTDDRAWPLPMYPEYRDAIKSKIADIKNISNVRGSAGTICGAEFLKAFVGETPWAHLDIAGTAFVDGDAHWYYGHGATGYGVRLLTDYILES